MINEFMQLAKALPLQGLKENRLRSLPGNMETYRVWLTREGKISNIELLTEEIRQSLRKYAPNNQYSFPAFNQWIVSKDDEVHKGEYDKAIKCIRRNIIAFPQENPKKKELKLFKVKNLVDEDETLGRMFKVLAHITSEKDFLDELVEGFLREDFKIILPKQVSLFFDVVDYVEYPMSHKHSLDRLNDLLCESANEDANQLGVDAFGTSITGSKELMRSLDVPHWGTVKLRSSNSEIPSLTRYGLTESDSFPIGRLSRGEIETAFQHVFDEANEGFTYSRIEKEEILLAYPADVATRQKTPLVRMFGGGNDSERERLAFRKVAQNVIELLKGEGKDLPNRELRIFSIRKMDKARTKVVYYRNIDVATLASASEEWNEGCHNLPILDVKDWPIISRDEQKSGNAKNPIPVEIETVFPARLYRDLNKYYKRDFSTEDIEVARFNPSTGMDLMLMNADEVVPFAQSILSQVMIQAGNYYRALCVSLGKEKVASAKDKGLHLGILGLLLYKVGKRKDNYMKETAFLLGKFLRIADGLHRCYCDSERKGDYPNELCGSAMLSAMMENPQTALAQFGQRSAPYVKWAQSCQKKDYMGLAHWWFNQWQPIADSLHAAELPSRLNDAERAELFLGYLSSLPRKEKSEDLTTENNKENN